MADYVIVLDGADKANDIAQQHGINLLDCVVVPEEMAGRPYLAGLPQLRNTTKNIVNRGAW